MRRYHSSADQRIRRLRQRIGRFYSAEKTFVDSVGLAVLFDLIFPLQAKGKQVRIAEPAAHFRKVFDIVGLSKDVEIYESEEQAVAGW